jgi:small subunit ribosomal protein S3e
LSRALTEAGYAGFEVNKTPAKTTIKIRSTNTAAVAGPEGRR